MASLAELIENQKRVDKKRPLYQQSLREKKKRKEKQDKARRQKAIALVKDVDTLKSSLFKLSERPDKPITKRKPIAKRKESGLEKIGSLFKRYTPTPVKATYKTIYKDMPEGVVRLSHAIGKDLVKETNKDIKKYGVSSLTKPHITPAAKVGYKYGKPMAKAVAGSYWDLGKALAPTKAAKKGLEDAEKTYTAIADVATKKNPTAFIDLVKKKEKETKNIKKNALDAVTPNITLAKKAYKDPVGTGLDVASIIPGIAAISKFSKAGKVAKAVDALKTVSRVAKKAKPMPSSMAAANLEKSLKEIGKVKALPVKTTASRATIKGKPINLSRYEKTLTSLPKKINKLENTKIKAKNLAEIKAKDYAKELRQFHRQERDDLYKAIKERGGIKKHVANQLSEEYKTLPHSLKNKKGLPSDEMASELGYPDARSLLDDISKAKEKKLQKPDFEAGGKKAAYYELGRHPGYDKLLKKIGKYEEGYKRIATKASKIKQPKQPSWVGTTEASNIVNLFPLNKKTVAKAPFDSKYLTSPLNKTSKTNIPKTPKGKQGGFFKEPKKPEVKLLPRETRDLPFKKAKSGALGTPDYIVSTAHKKVYPIDVAKQHRIKKVTDTIVPHLDKLKEKSKVDYALGTILAKDRHVHKNTDKLIEALKKEGLSDKEISKAAKAWNAYQPYLKDAQKRMIKEGLHTKDDYFTWLREGIEPEIKLGQQPGLKQVSSPFTKKRGKVAPDKVSFVSAAKTYIPSMERRLAYTPRVVKELEDIAAKYPKGRQEYARKWLNEQVLSGTNKGNLGRKVNRAWYNMLLGTLNPSPAFKQLGQRVHVGNLAGWKNLAKAQVGQWTPGGHKVLKSIKKQKLPEMIGDLLERSGKQNKISKAIDKAEKGNLALFNLAEKGNRNVSNLAAFYKEMAKAKKLKGAKRTAAIKKAKQAGVDLENATQYVYGKLGESPYLRSSIPRMLSQFTSFPRKTLQMGSQMARNEIPGGRKALAKLAAEVAGAYAIGKQSGFSLDEMLGTGLFPVEQITQYDKDKSKIQNILNPEAWLALSPTGKTINLSRKILKGKPVAKVKKIKYPGMKVTPGEAIWKTLGMGLAKEDKYFENVRKTSEAKKRRLLKENPFIYRLIYNQDQTDKERLKAIQQLKTMLTPAGYRRYRDLFEMLSTGKKSYTGVYPDNKFKKKSTSYSSGYGSKY